jgi:hypothetical protein
LTVALWLLYTIYQLDVLHSANEAWIGHNKACHPAATYEKEKVMEEKEKLIDEIAEQALQYDMKYYG